MLMRLVKVYLIEMFNQARFEMVLRTAGLLTGASMGSVKTLVDLQNDVAVAPGVRRRAARDVLEMGLKFRESADLEQRLAALEDRLAGGAADAPENGPADSSSPIQGR